MALFGTARDVSLFRHMSRELMADIITEQCGYYKYKLEETKINLYGEAADEKLAKAREAADDVGQSRNYRVRHR